MSGITRVATARRASRKSVRATARELGISAGQLGDHESGRRALSRERERAVLHHLALGERGPLEQEHDADPNWVVMYELLGPPAQLAFDDDGRVPLFADPQLAAVTAAGLAEWHAHERTYAAPTWANGLSDVLLRREAGGAEALEAMSQDERDALADRLAGRVYLVEAQVTSPAEALALAEALPARIVQGMANRFADFTDGLTGGAS